MRREVAEQGIAGLQVSACDHEPPAVPSAEQRRRGTQWDENFDLLAVANWLQGTDSAFGLVWGAAFVVDFGLLDPHQKWVTTSITALLLRAQPEP